MSDSQTLRVTDNLAQEFSNEATYQDSTLCLVASRSIAIQDHADRSAQVLGNITTEGYPGARFHAGSEYADVVEVAATTAACELYGAQWANVQPLSASNANLAVMTSLLAPGDRILSMKLDSGGHLTHGSPASFTGKFFKVSHYGLGQTGDIDYDEVRDAALRWRPKLLICGASSFPLNIDFARFRTIADEVGAVLLADVSHPAGLIAAGLYPSPIDHAHFTTLCTHKQLFGPKGGVILSGRSAHDDLPIAATTPARAMDRAVFPGFQGSPDYASIARKALTLKWARTDEFTSIMERTKKLASILAEVLSQRFTLVGGGTDSHLVVADLRPRDLSGHSAEEILGRAGILCNRNQVPNDPRSPRESSGLRFGTNIAGFRGISDIDFWQCSEVIGALLEGQVDTYSASRVVKEVLQRYSIPELTR